MSRKSAYRNALEGVLQFVIGTRDLGICFPGCNFLDICGYNDFKWAGDEPNRKSTKGYLYMRAHGAFTLCCHQCSVLATFTSGLEHNRRSTAWRVGDLLHLLLLGMVCSVEVE